LSTVGRAQLNIDTGTAVDAADAGGGEVWNVLREWVLRPDATSVNGGGLSSLGQRVVSRVEVFAFFQVFGQVVSFGGELAVETEETLFVGRERLGLQLV
jgi:hypothetical protein